MTLLDIEKAFDSVWHDALLHKIKNYGFPIHLIKIIATFLQNRLSFVSVHKGLSDCFAIPAGVLQGSPLSPFLFNIFINDIPVPRHCKIAVYADDKALYSSIENYKLSDLITRMESSLNEIECSSEVKNYPNAAKTHIQKMQVAQNKCLRMALSAPYRTRISSLHKSANISTVKEFVAKLTENFYKHSARSENKLVKRLGEYTSRSHFSRLKHKLPRPSS
jgi:Reverse transcriptase (RNA-dependent DNA polymerase)